MIEIRQIKQEAFPSYAALSSEFMVESELECVLSDGGLGGILLRERPLAQAYSKYQDGEGPEEWSQQFDTQRWGFFLACNGDEPVGAAAVARPSEVCSWPRAAVTSQSFGTSAFSKAIAVIL